MKILILSGTVGSGKSTVSAQVVRGLARAGHVAAMVDVDCLTRVEPAPLEDPFNSRLARAHLRLMLPNFRQAGVEFLVLPRVIETADDRAEYCAALTPHSIVVARLQTAASSRRARLRPPEVDEPQVG